MRKDFGRRQLDLTSLRITIPCLATTLQEFPGKWSTSFIQPYVHQCKYDKRAGMHAYLADNIKQERACTHAVSTSNPSLTCKEQQLLLILSISQQQDVYVQSAGNAPSTFHVAQWNDRQLSFVERCTVRQCQWRVSHLEAFLEAWISNNSVSCHRSARFQWHHLQRNRYIAPFKKKHKGEDG